MDLAKLMREWLDILATGPAEAWRGKVAEDLIIRLPFAPPGVNSTLVGFDQAVEALSTVWKSKLRFTWLDVVIRTTEDPELLVTTARSEVLLVSGQNYANTYVMLTRFREGKVIEHVEYFNPLLVMEAYGPTKVES
jgi:ketosteroid isomerase-like protein